MRRIQQTPVHGWAAPKNYLPLRRFAAYGDCLAAQLVGQTVVGGHPRPNMLLAVNVVRRAISDIGNCSERCNRRISDGQRSPSMMRRITLAMSCAAQ
jgi:hypothetical protein